LNAPRRRRQRTEKGRRSAETAVEVEGAVTTALVVKRLHRPSRLPHRCLQYPRFIDSDDIVRQTVVCQHRRQPVGEVQSRAAQQLQSHIR
jgi:hypothetical protein